MDKLRVAKEQKSFVAPNSESLIDAYFAVTEEVKKVFTFGIYCEKKAVDFVRTAPCGKAEYCWLSYEPENVIARKLYLSSGFEEKQELCKEDEEIPAVMKIWD